MSKLTLPYEAIRYDFGSPAREAGVSSPLQEAEFPKRFRAPVPVNLIAIRHAPSELNVMNDLLRRDGKLPAGTEGIEKIPDNIARLAVGAEGYAKSAAKWLTENLNFSFDAAYCSPFVRARETAGHIGTEGEFKLRWKIDSRIGERSYGEFHTLSFEQKVEEWKKRREDVRYWTPPNGESLEHIELEARDMLRAISSRYHSGNVLMVSHGEFLVALRSVIEYPSSARLQEFLSDSPPNCGIIHYSRRDPDTGDLAPYYKWVRLVNPMGAAGSWDGKWRGIERASYSNEELLAEAQSHPRYFSFSTRN